MMRMAMTLRSWCRTTPSVLQTSSSAIDITRMSSGLNSAPSRSNSKIVPMVDIMRRESSAVDYANVSCKNTKMHVRFGTFIGGLLLGGVPSAVLLPLLVVLLLLSAVKVWRHQQTTAALI